MKDYFFSYIMFLRYGDIMAIINLHVEKLESINNEFKSLSTTLSNTYYNDLESELTSIKNNIRNERVHSAINTIIEQFKSI